MRNKINLNEFLGKINAYKLSFLEKSITGKLVELNGDFLKIELRNGNVIVASVDSLKAIWNIRQKQGVV
jgi:hypothetical protein